MKKSFLIFIIFHWITIIFSQYKEENLILKPETLVSNLELVKVDIFFNDPETNSAPSMEQREHPKIEIETVVL